MPSLTARPLSAVRRESVRWLWEPYIPCGKITLLDGDPEMGKSLFTIDLAARLSRGRSLPDGQPADGPQSVILLNAEDSAADTTRPRAEAAGADLDRLCVPEDADAVRLPADLPALETLVRDTAAALLVLDPLMAFLPPGVAANADQCVRTALTPLAALAERTGCAILLVRHLRKADTGSALRRGLGSMGIVAAARTALLAGRHPADPSLNVLAVSKSNLARVRPSLAYRAGEGANGQSVVEWVGPVDVTADALGGKPPKPSSAMPDRDRAGGWLLDALAGGPRPAAELLRAAAAAGIPERTLYRAKEATGVKSHQLKRNGRPEWYWYDPSAPWPKDAPFPKPFELPPLPDLPPLG